MTACDLYRGWFYHHGALRLASSLGWGLQMLKEDARRLGLHEASSKLETAWQNVRAQSAFLPYANHPAITDPELPSYVRDWFQHDTPGDFWSSMDLSRTAEKITIPALHVSGWYDTYLEGSMQGFELLRNQAGSDHARENQYLLAGPWIHIPWADRAGDAHFGDEALLDTDALLLQWFDHWLKDAQTFAAQPRVRHFALGVNRWFDADAATGNSETILYLHSQGRAESRKGNGTLSPIPPQQDPPDVFVYDPEVPVLAPGGPLALSGMFDQNALESGNNLLVYTSEPLTHPTHIFGSPRVMLYASTSATHADLTAKLIRVTADRAEFCCIGIARSTYLFADHYQPDQVHCWEFTLEPTSYVFAKGDRVRLEIAASAFPLYDRNPSNVTKPSQMSQWNWQRSTHILHHDAERPSALHLPVIA
jgi:putative CocE/NonD family hydrolase